LFITATDTEVGKTVITCAMAAVLRRRGVRVAVCKPYASGCRAERGDLINPDAEALAHFADCRLPLHIINPMRYRLPLAPSVAAERENRPTDIEPLERALGQLDGAGDVMLVEGVGGLLCPLDEKHTVLDLAVAIGYPVLVVTRGNLGTLSHTAMTCRLIRQAALPLAGLVINRYHVDTPDIAEATNPRQLAHQNDTQVLATVPDAPGVDPASAKLPADVLDAVDVVDWKRLCRKPCREVKKK